MRLDLEWRGPAELTARLRSWRPLGLSGAKQVNKEVKALARRQAPHVVAGDGSHLADAVSGFLEELAARRVFDPLVRLHVPAGQQPRAREGPGDLFDDQDAPGVIDTRDDRAGARILGIGRFGHARYGFLVGDGEGGRVALGRGLVGVGLGVRDGEGERLGEGDGDGDGDGHGSDPIRFHV